MSDLHTLQQLRDTLDQHAGDVESANGDVGAARVTAVRGRARRVRRQRAAGLGVAAVLAVAAATAVPLLSGDHTPAPADRQLIGRVAPATLTSLGYTYHFVEGVESGDEPATIRLPAADGPRLVTWASDADDVRVHSNVEGYSTRSSATGFDDFVLVPGVESARFTVRAGGDDAALAVYELGDERPPGYTVDGITFRQQVADQQLLDARIGEEGVSDLTLELALPDNGVRVAELCAGLPDGYVVNVEVASRGVVSSSGCADDTFDPGNGSASFFEPGQLGRPGDTVPVRTWVSRRHNGTPVEVDEVRLGLAAYELIPPVTTVAGWDVPALIEHEGHRWVYVDSVESRPGDRRLVVERDWARPTLVVAHTRGVRQLVGRTMIGSGLDATIDAGGGASSGHQSIVGPGRERFPITVRRGLTDRSVLGVSLYERTD